MSVFGVFKVLEPEQCPVCFEPLQIGQDVYEGTNCAHVFHKQCAENWVSQGRFSCPTCRKPWNKDDFVVGSLSGALRSVTDAPSRVTAFHRTPAASNARRHSTHGRDEATAPSRVRLTTSNAPKTELNHRANAHGRTPRRRAVSRAALNSLLSAQHLCVLNTHTPARKLSHATTRTMMHSFT